MSLTPDTIKNRLPLKVGPDLADHTPMLAGLGMLAAGFLLRRTAPRALNLPEPGRRKRLRDVGSGKDAAHVARDGIANVTPRNLTSSLGRTLIMMGAATIAIRALDELVDDDAADY